MFGDHYYTVGWILVFACLAMGLFVPVMWPVAVWGLILAFFMAGAKPLEEMSHSDNVVESTVGKGGAVLWVLLTLGAMVASIFIIGG